MVPPEILKVAREFLGLSQEQVEKRAGISKATVYRVEKGVRDLPHYALLVQHFYEQHGIEFVAPVAGRGWGIFNHNTASGIQNCAKSEDTRGSATETEMLQSTKPDD